VGPIINEKGKIEINSKNKLLLESRGSGAFLTQISKTKIFKTWEKAGIKYLNIIDLKNLNTKILDPFSLGMMIERGYDCISDAYEREANSTEFKHPFILGNKFKYFDLFYPFELERIKNIQKDTKNIFRFESLHLNMFTTINFLKENFKLHSGKVFEFRIKELKSEEKG